MKSFNKAKSRYKCFALHLVSEKFSFTCFRLYKTPIKYFFKVLELLF